MKKEKYPILEYDPSPTAIINPDERHKDKKLADKGCCVLCFFKEAVIKASKKSILIDTFKTEMMDFPIYKTFIDDSKVFFAQSPVGSPVASGLMEYLGGLGIETFLACGGAGVLCKDITLGNLIIPTSAIREDGTSYHYQPPSREINSQVEININLEKELKKAGFPYVKGKTWTTDGYYRETTDKVNMRKKEGALCVEMENASFLAVASFRNLRFAQILYGGDDLSSDKWDHREWDKHPIREKLFSFCLETVSKI